MGAFVFHSLGSTSGAGPHLGGGRASMPSLHTDRGWGP